MSWNGSSIGCQLDDVNQLDDPLFAFLDSEQREVHVTLEFAAQYQGPVNPHMWNMSLYPEKPQVQINLASVEEGEENEKY